MSACPSPLPGPGTSWESIHHRPPAPWVEATGESHEWLLGGCLVPSPPKRNLQPNTGQHTGMKDIELFRLYLKSNTSSV